MSSLILDLFLRGHGLCFADMLSTLIPYPQLPSLPLIDDSLAIHPFGVLVATGILVGSWLTIRRGKVLGLDEEKVKNMIFWSLLTGFLLSHFSDVLIYQKHPTTGALLRALADPRSGLSSMGGFAGAVLGLFVWCRRNGERVMPYADSLAYGLATGWFFGRMGCYVAHDHPGELMATSDPLYFLGVDYPCPATHCAPKGSSLLHIGSEFRRHDMGFEEALFAATLAGGYLLWGTIKPRLGVFVASIATLYGPIRFALDRLRVREGIGADPRTLGLTPAQYAAIAVTLIGLGLWVYVFTRPAEQPAATTVTPVAPGAASADSAKPDDADAPSEITKS